MTQDQQDMIEDSRQRCSLLDDWEADFIGDLARITHSGLTPAQDAKLTEIWERVTNERGIA